MRTLTAGALMGLDGVIGTPHVWASEYFDDDARADALAKLRASDAMLMGRKTYEIFSKLWPAQEGPYADRVNEIPKHVFSSTLESTEWSNVTIVRGDVAEEVARIKGEGDGPLVMYGYGQLGQALMEAGLVDELRVWIHPRFVGTGTLMFREGHTTKLEHVETQELSTGVVMLSYRPLSAS